MDYLKYVGELWQDIGWVGRGLIYTNVGMYALKFCAGSKTHLNLKRRRLSGEDVSGDEKKFRDRTRRLRWPTPIDAILHTGYRMNEEDVSATRVWIEGAQRFFREFAKYNLWKH